MATMQAVTTCNRPEVAQPDKLEKELEDWEFRPAPLGSLSVSVENGQLSVHGAAEFDPVYAGDTDDPQVFYNHDPDHRNLFLEAISPYLDENLVIQTVTHTKQRYPVGGICYLVNASTGETKIRSLLDIQSEFFVEEDTKTVSQ